jgi:dTDP-D-glucose 4,6-dehydratase
MLLTKCTGWKPLYNTEQAVEKTFKWYYNFENGSDVSNLVNCDIEDYLNET